MAEKSAIEKLQNLLDESTWHSWHGEWMKKPFRCGDYLCATDGHFLVGIKDVKTKAPAIPISKGRGNSNIVEGLLAEEVAGPFYDAAHLKAWSGRTKPACNICHGSLKQSCDDCGGKGCYTCGQSGQVDCACHYAIPGEVFGKVLNILLVHRALKLFSGAFQVGGSRVKETSVIFGGENWKAAIMPMRLPADEVYKPVELKTPNQCNCSGHWHAIGSKGCTREVKH